MWNILFSRPHETNPPIRPELIHMALNNGIVAEDDYLARSYNTLPDIVTEINENYTTNDALPLEHLNDILEPNYQPGMENGYVRLADWSWYFICKTNLRNCNGEMFDWWFNHCDCSERFRWSHPTENTDGGEYDPPFYAVQPEDRKDTHFFFSLFNSLSLPPLPPPPS
jgi:hypothetical protein